MKKITTVLVVMAVLVGLTVSASAIEIKYSGEMVVQMIDAEKDIFKGNEKFFHLGSIDEDPSADHSFLQLQGVVNDDISATMRFDINWLNTVLNATEEAYLTIKNVRGLPEGHTIKAGLFYVPMGLQVWKYGIEGDRDNNGVEDYGPAVSLRTDTGVELTGASKEFNYKIAIVDGQEDNGRDIIARFTTTHKNIPVGISYNRGKVGESKLNNFGVDATYKFSDATSATAEVIKYKEGKNKADLNYLSITHKFTEPAITGYAKYYEISPKATGYKKTKINVIGGEYQYAENTTLKVEFINRDTGGNPDPKDNIYKAELKVKF